MPVIFTAIARVKDWQALQELNSEVIVVKARSLKAKSYQIYRNPNDASQALLWVELRDPDDVPEMREALVEQFKALTKVRLIDERSWEPTDWEVIEA
jgi:hypothetical protein